MLIVAIILLVALCVFVIKIDKLTYIINNDYGNFKIGEVYNDDYYDIEIKISDKKYLMRIDNIYNNKRKLVTDVYYYKDEVYECLLPIINNNLVTDMMCYKDNILYNYQSIKGNDNKLDVFISDNKYYDNDKFTNNLSKKEKIESIIFYSNKNINKNVSITTYNGIISNKKSIILFDKDVYKNSISTYINNYYITADYNNNYDFKYLYVINLKNNEIFKIKSKDSISFDSYIQGIVDNNIYLYDIDNESQYKINIENKKIELISTDSKIKYYKNRKWETINSIKANKKIVFDNTLLDNDFSDYDYVIKSDWYYYLFKKDGNLYNLYRVNNNSLDIIEYIMTIPTKNINCKDNYFYYVYDNKLYYYNDMTGLRTILEDDELKYNDTIKYYIY